MLSLGHDLEVEVVAEAFLHLRDEAARDALTLVGGVDEYAVQVRHELAIVERAGEADKARPVPRRGRGCVLRGRPGGQLRHGPLLGRARRA